MTETLSIGGLARNPTANTALKAAARFWVAVAVIGQWLFAYYVAAFYGGAVVRGDLQAWNKILFHGRIAGDSVGNSFLAVHLFLAVVITVCGPLQLIPQIRARALSLHRWNGRLYILTAFTTSIAALYLVFSRKNLEVVSLL